MWVFGPEEVLLFLIAVYLVALLIWTLYRLPAETALGMGEANTAKLREHLVEDIRAANTYCLAFVALFGVLSLLVANNRDALLKHIDKLHLWPFAVAFVAASISLLFIPGGYGGGLPFKVLRMLWLRTVLCENVVILMSFFGTVSALLVLLKT